MKCPCCDEVWTCLGDYISHQCKCQDNCQMMDLFSEVSPPKKSSTGIKCNCCGIVEADLGTFLMHQCACGGKCDVLDSFVREPKVKGKAKRRCAKCKRTFMSDHRYTSHLCEPSSLLAPPPISTPHLTQQALRGQFRVYELSLKDMIDPDRVSQETMIILFNLLTSCLNEIGPIKYYFVLTVIFKKLSNDELLEANCPSIFKTLLPADDVTLSITASFSEIKEIIDQFTEMGSGFWIKNIPKISVWIARYKPHRGGCMDVHLPKALADKKCILTIETHTDCFMYSILAGIYPKTDNRGRVNLYDEHINSIDFSRWRGEVKFTQIDSFERKNQISVSVFTYDEKEKFVIPIKISKNLQPRHVRLFWYKKHYYLITNFSY